MSNKFIFLDVDGVLNHQQWFGSAECKENKGGDYEKSQFSPISVALLNNLTDVTGADIVVSSSWRKGRTLEQLQELFESVGITGKVIGMTPCLYFTGLEGYSYSVPRGCEIKAWLETNKGILGEKMSKVRYVILDDDSDMLLWQREHYLWVDPYCGITPNIIYKAKKILMS